MEDYFLIGTPTEKGGGQEVCSACPSWHETTALCTRARICSQSFQQRKLAIQASIIELGTGTEGTLTSLLHSLRAYPPQQTIGDRQRNAVILFLLWIKASEWKIRGGCSSLEWNLYVTEMKGKVLFQKPQTFTFLTIFLSMFLKRCLFIVSLFLGAFLEALHYNF